jgi:hypothetical protein
MTGFSPHMRHIDLTGFCGIDRLLAARCILPAAAGIDFVFGQFVRQDARNAACRRSLLPVLHGGIAARRSHAIRAGPVGLPCRTAHQPAGAIRLAGFSFSVRNTDILTFQRPPV